MKPQWLIIGVVMNQDVETTATAGIASLEHLTGPSRGTATWLSGERLKVGLGGNLLLRIAGADSAQAPGTEIAQLERSGDTYQITSQDGQGLWINGRPASEHRLRHGDMIEFGEDGPLSRYCLHHENEDLHRSLGGVLRDAAVYLRVSRKPLAARIYRAVCQVARRLTRETTILFRLGVLASIIVLGALVYQQYQLSTLLRSQLEQGASQLDTFARTLAQTRKEALTPGDLEALRQELSPSVAAHEERLAELERRSGASARVIAKSASMVAFLQGSYGFKETATGRMLRHVVAADGRPVMSAFGRPMLTLEGNGPVAERQHTGTGFLVGPSGLLITNRHVAAPWGNDADFKAMQKKGLEPVTIKFIAYFPGDKEPRPLSLIRASESVDLALVGGANAPGSTEGLPLAGDTMKAGEEVIVLGFPTGLRSLLAQAGEAFIRELQAAKVSGFWELAARLAEAGRIAPLASRGIAGQVSAETVVYDAETTHGGSGAPVLNARGEVVAVNTAIIPKFGGSNLGVPVAKVRELLASAGLDAGQ